MADMVPDDNRSRRARCRRLASRCAGCPRQRVRSAGHPYVIARPTADSISPTTVCTASASISTTATAAPSRVEPHCPRAPHSGAVGCGHDSARMSFIRMPVRQSSAWMSSHATPLRGLAAAFPPARRKGRQASRHGVRLLLLHASDHWHRRPWAGAVTRRAARASIATRRSPGTWSMPAVDRCVVADECRTELRSESQKQRCCWRSNRPLVPAAIPLQPAVAPRCGVEVPRIDSHAFASDSRSGRWPTWSSSTKSISAASAFCRHRARYAGCPSIVGEVGGNPHRASTGRLDLAQRPRLHCIGSISTGQSTAPPWWQTARPPQRRHSGARPAVTIPHLSFIRIACRVSTSGSDLRGLSSGQRARPGSTARRKGRQSRLTRRSAGSC